ncbi:hypothetical protein FNW02_16100 [Komarekiella sp. 'clone 1']|uniref:Uncharacterized protein n=1 Tax=Komarekiella delphini-convector SJRDD-AB1 TaxID=2593771 RepID=A0AA40SYG5_9NOST|nr:hypothetical protein [Komarekiella delphini-convector]MBD6617308.1 hypothetical protein [Komarekiella delphini-convector SJRDD-AB1]
MFNHRFFTLLLTDLLADVGGCLINQWSIIREFPSRKSLIISWKNCAMSYTLLEAIANNE